MPGHSELADALSRGLVPEGDLARELEASQIASRPLVFLAARDLCECLGRVSAGSLRNHRAGEPGIRLRLLASLFQGPADHETCRLLAREGVPHLLRLYDEELTLPGGDESNLLFLLKVLALYRSRAGLARLVAAARQPRFRDRYLWSAVFQVFDAEHPLRHEVCDELRNPLPEGFVAVAYLDLVNQLAIRGELGEHPFDKPPGLAMLQDWLTRPDEGTYSYAVSAAVAAPFVSPPGREQLLALALDHPGLDVQLEAAWASARLGSRGGLRCLARLCLDPRISAAACAYLRELDRDEDIPPQALHPDFQAVARLSRWLAQPQQFGRPPQDVDLFDTRELSWPPTNDQRRLWLIRYRYPAEVSGGPDREGVGLVGSVTAALAGEVSPARTPEDVYALHCCWELQRLADPRAPAERSVAAGRRLLGWDEPLTPSPSPTRGEGSQKGA